MRNIKITIEYDGTHFCGWQQQAKNERTVQGEIIKAIYKVTGEKVHLQGAGRTDSGVHALGQVANFKIHSSLPPETLLRALNANLPDDVAITKVEEVSKDFHAQYDAKTKTYRYLIVNRIAPSAYFRQYCLFVPQKLNIRRMQAEAKALVGKHDFRSFQASDPARRTKEKSVSSIRTVKRCNIRKKGDLIIVEIEADGFLYKMVRNIVGTLIDIGLGKLPKGAMRQILKQKDRSAASATAKPQGLCLLKVTY